MPGIVQYRAADGEGAKKTYATYSRDQCSTTARNATMSFHKDPPRSRETATIVLAFALPLALTSEMSDGERI
jgi:hypothetical protein